MSDHDDWSWGDELTLQVDRLVGGELTLKQFREWYRARDALTTATPEQIKAFVNEWRVDTIRKNIVKALKT